MSPAGAAARVSVSGRDRVSVCARRAPAPGGVLFFAPQMPLYLNVRTVASTRYLSTYVTERAL